MSEQNPTRSEQERIRLGQSAARGATGDGRTGVPAGEQGISNRPGDAPSASAGDRDDASGHRADEAEGEGEANEDEGEAPESGGKPG